MSTLPTAHIESDRLVRTQRLTPDVENAVARRHAQQVSNGDPLAVDEVRYVGLEQCSHRWTEVLSHVRLPSLSSLALEWVEAPQPQG